MGKTAQTKIGAGRPHVTNSDRILCIYDMYCVSRRAITLESWATAWPYEKLFAAVTRDNRRLQAIHCNYVHDSRQYKYALQPLC